MQWSRAARPGRRVQSRVLVFKDGHPNLVGLPSPIPNRLSTVNRRFHPVALAQADARSAEAVEHRTRDAPSQWTERAVPVTLGLRLESSRPPCGETERRPDSSAPYTDVPRVDGLPPELSPRFPAHASAIGFCNPHDPRTRLARFAPTRLRDLSAPPLTPVRVRNSSFRCRGQMG